MTRKRTSPVWLKSKNEIQKLLNESSSFVEVLEKLGLCGHSGNHRTLKERIKLDNLNTEILKAKRTELIRQSSIKKKIPLSKIMVENSSYGTNHLKSRLIKENILKYTCERCGNKGEWMGQKLTLQLEHKNGKSIDHRLENLCFLCPNCHSQTDTYSGRNSSMKKSRICIECKGPTKGKGKICRLCVSKNQPKKFIITKKELEKLVKKYPMTSIGKKFGVSDNAIRKRCDRLGVEWRKKSG
jgi:5-methylcytosine-specific restriction endonuclease McrA